ncbi:prenyltransferase/squalene oxidase repeat-containing protein [Aeromicrobium wangtongii]|uniref:Terpene cyclase/mutase family protein n=1 Tax=Aeromicrobium wangtongii TaxID=2969247 RepID=A0ABY5M5E1_9ACTN|nr:prenyltransferase/squalene oxidase repeat-containing protein [Aeromicrobium wangtongii]MCD9200133.1 terpene cyclase/mutase family protein [Aeromicrobium wangtongii]UUP13388.1 terpene cyclase/mutase family protein [Aeromicrobium wangtongii]
MNSTTLRRLGAAVIAPALAAGMVVAAPSAQAAPNSYAYSAARWLSDQLTDGVVHNEQYDFDDYGLTLDIFFALNALDTRAGDQKRIIDALSADPSVYTGSGTAVYAGATGKLATAVQASGGQADDVAGVDLIKQAEALVTSSGRASDTFDPADEYGADYSNAIGQSFVVRALSTARSPLADETVDYLLEQQCDDGSFRVQMADEQCTTTVGTIDATALAVQALQVAKGAGQADVQDDIDQAVAWLLGQQAPDGGFSDEGTSNTNSTGLAAATLRATGKDGAAGSAAAFIVDHQVTDAVAEDSLLASELGAVAFDQAALDAAKASGIDETTRDQFIRATAQAAIGVNAQLSATSLAVTVPSGLRKAGSTIAVSATGLRAGEKYSLSVAGGGSFTGSADAEGRVARSVPTPAGTAQRLVTVVGSRSNRVGTTAVTLLGARKITPKLRHKTVKKGKKQTISVSGLTPGERVRVYLGGKLVKSGTVYSNGTYTAQSKVGKKAGKKTVKVIGAFADRTGSKSFRVK